MKKALFFIGAIALLASCKNGGNGNNGDASDSTSTDTTAVDTTASVDPKANMNPGTYNEDSTVYTAGWDFNDEGVVALQAVPAVLNEQDSAEVVVAGDIDNVCKKKGCWMTMNLPDSQSMRVMFKDYAFFVPLDCSGKTATMKGIVKKETISIEDQKHFLMDEGADSTKIAAVTEPKVEFTFLASGVRIE